MPLTERSHPIGIDLRGDGRRVPIQLDRLTLAFVSGIQPLAHARNCLQRLWLELYPGRPIPDEVTLVDTIADAYQVSRAHVVKTAIARFS